MTFILVYDNEIYIMGEVGANCPLDDVIATESECRTAASERQRTFRSSLTNKQRPAGCLVWLSTNHVWFNTITNPSQTSTESGVTGVCKRSILVYLIHQNHL